MVLNNVLHDQFCLVSDWLPIHPE
uniref:Uncharacterized protein n=1 Tax=Arundo donax TaxID=35708 RepID=A0A0A9B0M5_ARUDO